MKIYRNTYRYKSKNDEQAVLRKSIREIAEVRIRYGYCRIHVLLLREGRKINHKRGYRLYCEEGMNLRQKTKRCQKSATRILIAKIPNTLNECWVLDFVRDQLYNGKRFRMLNKRPSRIKVDNGPKFISKALDAWAYFNHVQLDYLSPGTPTDNA